jgi:gamma-glutamyltranspeptidase / glutathione hydrolase
MPFFKKRFQVLCTAMCVALLVTAPNVTGQDADGGVGLGKPPASYRPSVPGVHGLVAAGHPLAAMAGLQVLMKGGNAIDAAVAVGSTLNMMEPQFNGIGGNGFMTIYDKRSEKVYSLSMTGAAPAAIKGADMTAETLDWGINSGIVPGNFGGYVTALQRFGTMSLAEVFASAIDYADHGYPIDPTLAAAIDRAGRPPLAGELFRNPDLAATLRKAVEAEQIALKQKKSRVEAIQAAFDRFYKGDIAQEMVRFLEENHGSMTAADLAAFHATWAEPLHTTYHGYDVYSSPATSRGGFELEMALNLVEPYDLSRLKPGSPEALHLLIEAIKVTKADVYRYDADPKFTNIPVEEMLSKSYADSRRKLIELNKAMVYPGWGDPQQSKSSAPFALLQRPANGRAFPDDYDPHGDTTSFSIVDQYGNAVSCTPTLGGGFGNGVVIGNTGLLLNNGIRLGNTSPYPDNVNYVRGGQIPLLNNSPSMVLKNGKIAMVFGTPGGETQGQTELQMLVNVIDFHMPVQQAVEAPRFELEAKPNFYKPGSGITVFIEDRVPRTSLQMLESWGHHLSPTSDFTPSVGGMQAIVVDLEKGTMFAGADPRRTGYAVGW